MEERKNSGLLLLLGIGVIAGFILSTFAFLLQWISGPVYFVLLLFLVGVIVYIILKSKGKEYLKTPKLLAKTLYYPEHVLVEEIFRFTQFVLRTPMVYNKKCMKKPIFAGSGKRNKILYMMLRETYNMDKMHHFFIRYDQREVMHLPHDPSWSKAELKNELASIANDMCDNPADIINRIKKQFDPVTNNLVFEEVTTEPKGEEVIEHVGTPKREFKPKSQEGG